MRILMSGYALYMVLQLARQLRQGRIAGRKDDVGLLLRNRLVENHHTIGR